MLLYILPHTKNFILGTNATEERKIIR